MIRHNAGRPGRQALPRAGMGNREMMKLLNRELQALGTPEALEELKRRQESRKMREGVAQYPKLPPKAAKKNPAYAHWTSDPQYSYEQFFRANPAPEMPRASRLPVPMNAGPYLPDLFQTRLSDGYPAEYNPKVSTAELEALVNDVVSGNATVRFRRSKGRPVALIEYEDGRSVRLTPALLPDFIAIYKATAHRRAVANPWY